MPQFKIKLKGVYEVAAAAHPKDRNGDSKLTFGRIASELGLSHNTVWRYLSADHVVTQNINNAVLVLAQYFGVDWHDVVEAVEDDSEAEIKTPLLAIA